MMGWDPEYRYKILGRRAHANGECLLIFDLTATEMYQRVSAQGEKAKTSRIPVFPENWKGQFGLPLDILRIAELMEHGFMDAYPASFGINGHGGV